MNIFKILVVSSFFFLLAGCGSQDIPDPDPTYDTVGDDTSADTDGMSGSGLGEGQHLDDDRTAGELADIVYFDFDSYELRPDDADVAARHGIQLAENPGLNVRLEGHADERGSREYNIGLGERRAQAVRRVLLLQGAQPSQISTVSFGEERPVALGSNEDAWSQNRRVEFKYSN